MPKTTSAKVQKEIEQILKLEQRARELQNAMDSVQRRWDTKTRAVIQTPEWSERCERDGVYKYYNFGDVLA